MVSLLKIDGSCGRIGRIGRTILSDIGVNDMKVIGFKRNAAPIGSMAVAVATSYGLVWVDAHNFFVGRRTPISRREAIRAVQAAPYGRSYRCSAPAGRCYEQTRLVAA